MKMPNGEKAVVEIAKLRDYCLNPDHFRGRHKARVFVSALGLTADRAEELREALLEAALTNAAIAGDRDDFGQRYMVDFTMNGPNGEVSIRSCWIIRRDEDFPRLTSCYVF